MLAGSRRFSLHRLVLRDEIVDGEPQGFMGPIRSLVMLDPVDPEDGDGVKLLT